MVSTKEERSRRDEGPTVYVGVRLRVYVVMCTSTCVRVGVRLSPYLDTYVWVSTHVPGRVSVHVPRRARVLVCVRV